MCKEKFILINSKEISENNIKEMHIAYCFARDVKHYVDMEGYKKFEFYPSNFMYAYMCFNMIYDLFKKEKAKSGGKIWRNNVKERIEEFLKFLEEENEVEINIIEEIKIKNLEELLDKIEVNINNQDQIGYLEEFKKNMIKASKEKISKEELNNVLLYIDSVRNNLFHGSKKAGKLVRDGQGQRLKFYTNILLVVCELFFDSLEGVSLSEGYEIADNMEAWSEVK